MKRTWYPLIAAALCAYAATGQAEMDTALRLRLESIEARLPDVGRLEQLEQQIQRLAAGEDIQLTADGEGAAGGMFSLLQDVQRLQEQVRHLRGEIQSLEHMAKQREQRSRDLYQDLDRRLAALEQAVGLGGGASIGTDGGAGPGPLAPVDEAAAEKDYLAAFDQLKQGNYGQARTAFEAFVQQYPASEYADNAWYWLGEARYVDRRYEEALAAFRSVIERYPDSGKVAPSQYKIGVVLDEQGKTDEAIAQLRQVIQSHPNDHAAELARQRLQAIGGN